MRAMRGSGSSYRWRVSARNFSSIGIAFNAALWRTG
jgi:hypothetical protein